MAVHGLDQSNALTEAAQELSRALEHERSKDYRDETDEKVRELRRKNAKAFVRFAKQEYRKAFLAYTNPFNDKKTS